MLATEVVAEGRNGMSPLGVGCKSCGVAFDVGKRTCVEDGCAAAQKQVDTGGHAITIKKAVVYKRQEVALERWASCKYRSQKRGFGFDLTVEDVRDTIASPCVYCGALGPSQLDRKDNELGYLKSNVVAACKRCNTVKSMYLTYAEMLIVAEALGWKKFNVTE